MHETVIISTPRKTNSAGSGLCFVWETSKNMDNQNFDLLDFLGDYVRNGLPGNAPYVTAAGPRARVIEACLALQRGATRGEAAALARVHQVLAFVYDQRFGVPDVGAADVDTAPLFADVLGILESAMLEREYALIWSDALASMPVEGARYVEWLKGLISDHPASVHRFYREHLREHATVQDMRVFLAQETTLDPRFDDILAMLQLGTSGEEKMEIAKNYFDEMGNGNPAEVHTHLFSKALQALDITPEFIGASLLPESRVSGNLSACLALGPRHHFKALGYFGVTEYLAPRRFKDLVAGWRRLRLPESGIVYHDLHIRIDAVHGLAWMQKVILPMVDQDPRVRREIAMGALIRLNSSQRYLDSLQAALHRPTSDLFDLRVMVPV